MIKHPYRLLIALLCILPGALLLCGFVLPSQYHDTYLGEMQHKMQLLRETPGKRIVVIGGSSVPFALDTMLMNEQLPAYQTVDFGLYADLGLPVMLDWAKAEIHEGDIFVLMPEQDEQILSGFIGGESVWQAVDGAWNMLPLLNLERYETLAAVFPMFAGKKLRYTLLGRPQASGVYSRSAFNTFGDMASPDRASNIMPDGWLTNRPISFEAALLTNDTADEINRFAAFIHDHGAQVVYHLPPMNALAVDAVASDIDNWYDRLSSQLNMPILGDPHRCVMDSGWFYDSNFHLNASGAKVFTGILIEDIKLYLRSTTPTSISLPDQPIALHQSLQGSNEDADCFIYEETENGYLLTGLTDAGQCAEALVLPAHINGQPVIGMASDLLHNLTALRRVTVQPNISMLPDGMFSGCGTLRSVKLTGQPSDYSVGDDWMQGASFVILVSPSCLDTYRRSYFWQQYEAWLLADE